MHESNQLDHVLGRQPNPGVFTSPSTTTTEVDEFGRSIKSQHVLQREKRIQQRELIQQEQKKRRKEQEAQSEQPLTALDDQDWMLDSEIDTWRDQRSALQEALQFAISQVRNDYTKISEVIKLFSEWYQYDPQ